MTTYWIAKDKNNEIYIFDKKPSYKKDGWLKIIEGTVYDKLPNFVNVSNSKIIEICINI